MELDLEDFIEEVKFQMTEFDILEEEKILDWESKARGWVAKHHDKKCLYVRSEEDIFVKIKDEDTMTVVAQKYYQAVKNNQESDYWKRFQLI